MSIHQVPVTPRKDKCALVLPFVPKEARQTEWSHHGGNDTDGAFSSRCKVKLTGTGTLILMTAQGHSEELAYGKMLCDPVVLNGNRKAKNLGVPAWFRERRNYSSHPEK